MIRIVSYGICLASAAWLVSGAFFFRQSIRDDVNKAQTRMAEFDPESPGTHGKFLNSYYEDVYKKIPHMIIPSVLILAGTTVLFITTRREKTEQSE